MATRTIVILANSVKHQQHCVAGKCIQTREWIRPVSAANGAELSHEQAKCQNPYGAYNVKPLQKVIVGLAAHSPLPNQPENYIIDDSLWKQNYKIEHDELGPFIDTPADLWGGGDRVSYNQILNGVITIDQSLYLVIVSNLTLYKNQYDKRRASFEYNGILYNLAVTDPNFDELCQQYQGVAATLCVSLGEQFEGSCYKLVATII